MHTLKLEKANTIKKSCQMITILTSQYQCVCYVFPSPNCECNIKHMEINSIHKKTNIPVFQIPESRFQLQILSFSLREQRWNFLCGCPKACTRKKGECCLWTFQRFTERAGGLCSMPTQMLWICTRWDPTTTDWDPKCYTLTAQRTQRLDRHCCR